MSATLGSDDGAGNGIACSGLFPLLQTLMVETPPTSGRLGIHGNKNVAHQSKVFPDMINERLIVEWEEADVPVFDQRGFTVAMNHIYIHTYGLFPTVSS